MKTFKYAFVRSVPIMAGYIVLGLGFGVLLQSKGYGAGWALAMGGLIYAGSMQYVAIDLLAGDRFIGGRRVADLGGAHDADGQRAASILWYFDVGTL